MDDAFDRDHESVWNDGELRGGDRGGQQLDSWGVGDIGNTPVPQNVLNPLAFDPNHPWKGIRINCQANVSGVFPTRPWSNLQTFLVVNGLAAPLQSQGSSSSSAQPLRALATSSKSPDPKDLKKSQERVRAMMTSPTTKTELEARRARLAKIRHAMDEYHKRRQK